MLVDFSVHEKSSTHPLLLSVRLLIRFILLGNLDSFISSLLKQNMNVSWIKRINIFVFQGRSHVQKYVFWVQNCKKNIYLMSRSVYVLKNKNTFFAYLSLKISKARTYKICSCSLDDPRVLSLNRSFYQNKTMPRLEFSFILPPGRVEKLSIKRQFNWP